MYYRQTPQKTTLKVNKAYEGETIEQKINRIVNNKEPITDGAPLIYTERKHGVQPAYNIRSDRFDIAIDAMDKVTKSHLAQRENRLAAQAKEGMEKEAQTDKTTQKDGGPEPIQGK